MEKLFERIRGNTARLRFFFNAMPKGADLHNHVDGSVYAETFFKLAVEQGMILDLSTHKAYLPEEVPDEPPPGALVKLSPDMPDFHKIHMECIDAWSVRNFAFRKQYRTPAPDEFFFGTFDLFNTSGGGTDYVEFLALKMREIRARAEAENVLALEIMLAFPLTKAAAVNDTALNQTLKDLIGKKDSPALRALVHNIVDTWNADGEVQTDVADYCKLITDVHDASRDTAPEVFVRYQGFTVRNFDPLTALYHLYLNFKVCQTNKLLVGINKLTPENGETGLRDYWGHMEFFAVLKQRYPAHVTLHAGELTLGLVAPEELSSHIRDAVFQAGAERIGHGVSIPFEKDAQKTLAYMAAHGIPVEINLTSNEFILGVKDGEHPLLLYRDFNVPILICSDDPGTLRTTLSEQYVIAARRYRELSYADFKTYSFNGIKYAFFTDDEKARLNAELEKRFARFEEDMRACLGHCQNLPPVV